MSKLRFLEELGAEFKRIDAQGSGIQTSRRSPRWGRGRRGVVEAVVAGVAVLLVVGVAAVVLSAHARRPTGAAAQGHTVRVAFIPNEPYRQPFGAAVERSIAILRLRLGTVFRHVQVSRTQLRLEVVVAVRDAARGSRARIVALAAPAYLAVYDWEANALLPDGQTVASVLRTLPPGYPQNPSLLTASQRTALMISQGAGAPGQGSLSLYDAVKLAARQPTQPGADNAREGSQYYLFGSPGSSACRFAAKRYGFTPRPGSHCWLAGPAADLASLYGSLPVGIGRSHSQLLRVPQGIVVVQATRSTFSPLREAWNPAAQFYVLKDHAALFGADITHPQPSTNPSGTPDVTFGLTPRGGAEFHKLTGQVARRGQQVSGLGQTLDQHFAIALDGQLVTVPQLDFHQYPNGVTGRNGADITGGFTTQSAQTLATLLRFGPLPLLSLAAL